MSRRTNGEFRDAGALAAVPPLLPAPRAEFALRLCSFTNRDENLRRSGRGAQPGRVLDRAGTRLAGNTMGARAGPGRSPYWRQHRDFSVIDGVLKPLAYRQPERPISLHLRTSTILLQAALQPSDRACMGSGPVDALSSILSQCHHRIYAHRAPRGKYPRHHDYRYQHHCYTRDDDWFRRLHTVKESGQKP